MKISNEYQDMINPLLFERTPKAVLAALLVSEYVNRLGLSGSKIDAAVLNEWTVLYENSIVPQHPPNNKILTVK